MLTLYLATGLIGGDDVVTPPASDLLIAFRARYPAFAAVADDSVQVWLDEGATETAAWPAGVQNRGIMLYAAHRLAESGQGAGNVAQGVSSFKSGTFAASLSDSAASRTGFAATVYGREYLMLARRYFGGPRLAWSPPAYAV